MIGLGRPAVPDGYEKFTARGATVVARSALAPAVREAMAESSLYDYAARHPRVRTMAGRGAVYAVPLPGTGDAVVVRRSRRGGMIARLAGDRFVAATRAPAELRTALRLTRAGVPTPEVVAYAVYPAGPFLRRSDVATREIPRGRDLATALLNATDEEKEPMLAATARLLAALVRVGARHPDLNLKNILLAAAEGGMQAYVLDVDRIDFATPGSEGVARANFQRLARSARKWRELYGARIEEADIAWLAGAARAS